MGAKMNAMNGNSCNLCGSKDFKYLFQGEDLYYGLDGKFSIYRCRQCGLIFIHPQPDAAKLSKYYPDDYYSYSTKKDTSGIKEKLLKYLKDPFRIFYIFLYVKIFHFERGLKPVNNGNILDIGCGNGGLLDKFKKNGMNCCGIEMSDRAAGEARAKGFTVYSKVSGRLPFDDNYFDMVVMHHVLEHLPDPFTTLMEARRILKPKGRLIIAAPNSQSLCFRLFGKHWFQLDIPRHLYSFSKDTLKAYLEKCGFGPVKVRCNSTPFQFLSSLVCVYGKVLGKKILIKDAHMITENSFLWFLFSPLVIVCNLFKIGDSIDIIAVK